MRHLVRPMILVALVIAALAAWRLRGSAPRPDAAAAAAVGLAVDDYRAATPADRETLTQATAAIRAGRFADALAVLNRLEWQDDGPAHLRAVVLSGQCLLAGGQLAEAERLFAYAADRRPGDADAHRGLAAVYYDLGAAALVERHVRLAAAADPTDYRGWRLLAAQALDLQQLPIAEEAARAALARDPPADVAAAARRDLAAALAGQKRYQDALDAGGPPADPAARAVRAECLRSLGRPAEADREVDAGLAVAPDHPRLWVERGLSATARGDDPAAAAAFARAVATDEFDKAARYQLALACRRLGRADEAAAHEQKYQEADVLRTQVVELNARAIDRPWDPAPRRELAEACRRLGRPDLAGMWERAAAGCPPTPP